MNEQWRTVADFPDYSVSDHGRVRRDVAAAPSRAGRILSGSAHWTGYRRVNLRLSGASTAVSVHRLVAIAFLGQAPTAAHQVAHGDGCPANNHVNNLRWATHTENQRDRSRHGTNPVGERNGCSKLSAGEVRAIRAEYAAGGATQAQIGARYGVKRITVGDIVRRKRWPHLPD